MLALCPGFPSGVRKHSAIIWAPGVTEVKTKLTKNGRYLSWGQKTLQKDNKLVPVPCPSFEWSSCLFHRTVSRNLLSVSDPSQYFLFIPYFLCAWRKPLSVLPSLRASRSTFLLLSCQVFPGSRERHTWPVTSVGVEWFFFFRMIQQWSLLLFSFSNVFIPFIHFIPFRLLSYSPPFRICLVFFSVVPAFYRFLSYSRFFLFPAFSIFPSTTTVIIIIIIIIIRTR